VEREPERAQAQAQAQVQVLVQALVPEAAATRRLPGVDSILRHRRNRRA
jgi:hypothetical protein